jgi:hypothetical protein
MEPRRAETTTSASQLQAVPVGQFQGQDVVEQSACQAADRGHYSATPNAEHSTGSLAESEVL